jgi:hypothetical protein
MYLLLALGLPRAFVQWPLTVLTRQTGQALGAINQSIFLNNAYVAYTDRLKKSIASKYK